MKSVQVSCWLAILELTGLFLSGCKKQSARLDATQPLAQSFQAAQPEIKQAVGTATTNLRAGNYLQAARAFEPVLANPDLTAQQREAIGLALQQLKQAIDANPALDSKELYELRAKMFRAAAGVSRF